jgi:DNA repair exonuclease SbcCD ATPase subunit
MNYIQINLQAYPSEIIKDLKLWVNDFVRLRKCQAELKKLTTELNQIKKAPSPISEQLEAALSDLETLKKERCDFFSKHIRRSQSSGFRPFSSASMHQLAGSLSNKRYLIRPTEAEVKAAYGLLSEPEGALSSKEKKALTAKLDKKIAALKAEIEKLSPVEFFELRNGQVTTDYREKFLRDWQSLQNRCNEPISPFGFSLKTGSRTEKAAFKALGIDNYVNRATGLKANPNHRNYL